MHFLQDFKSGAVCPAIYVYCISGDKNQLQAAKEARYLERSGEALTPDMSQKFSLFLFC